MAPKPKTLLQTTTTLTLTLSHPHGPWALRPQQIHSRSNFKSTVQRKNLVETSLLSRKQHVPNKMELLRHVNPKETKENFEKIYSSCQIYRTKRTDDAEIIRHTCMEDFYHLMVKC